VLIDGSSHRSSHSAHSRRLGANEKDLVSFRRSIKQPPSILSSMLSMKVLYSFIALLALFACPMTAFAPPRMPSIQHKTTTSILPRRQATPQQGALPTVKTNRGVRKLEKYARLPVWPAWNGVFLWLMGNVLGQERAAQAEQVLTGRVCPNFFQETDQTSPFIMLVHHCHTFSPIDPLRFIQKLFFPEGFPAHPHRGFCTLVSSTNHPRHRTPQLLPHLLHPFPNLLRRPTFWKAVFGIVTVWESNSSTEFSMVLSITVSGCRLARESYTKKCSTK
jgi:hypothetical protein